MGLTTLLFRMIWSPMDFIPSTPIFCSTSLGSTSLPKLEVRVHYIQRHLHRIKLEIVFRRYFQHVEMDMRILVSCKSNVTHLAGFLGFQHSFLRAIFGKDPVRIVKADNLVVLYQVKMISLQAL